MTAPALPRKALGLAPRKAVATPAPRVRPWMVFTAAVVVAFFATTFSRISLDRTAFVLDDLGGQIAEEQARHWDLRAEVARMRAPVRITRLAREMGLEYPEARITLEIPQITPGSAQPEYRWAELRSLLSAQP